MAGSHGQVAASLQVPRPARGNEGVPRRRCQEGPSVARSRSRRQPDRRPARVALPGGSARGSRAHPQPQQAPATALGDHMVVRHDTSGALRAEYTLMLWYLLLVVAAIDRCTVKRGRVGVLADNAIILTPDEMQALGLQKGPSSRHGGYADRDYYKLVTCDGNPFGLLGVLPGQRIAQFGQELLLRSGCAGLRASRNSSTSTRTASR